MSACTLGSSNFRPIRRLVSKILDVASAQVVVGASGVYIYIYLRVEWVRGGLVHCGITDQKLVFRK